MSANPQRDPIDSLLPIAIQDTAVIDDVAKDMALLADPDTHLIPIIDPYDIIEFCFPFGPLQDSKVDVRADRVADAQAAWYELFYHWPDPPIILTEYLEEVARFHGYLRWQVNNIYKPIEFARKLIATADYERTKAKAKEGLLNLAEKEFNIALAVVMGLHSFGITRFNQLLRQRIQLEERGFARDDELAEIAKGYRVTRLKKTIFNELQNHTRARLAGADAIERNRVKLSNDTDATVVDKILYMNQKMASLYAQGITSKRYILTYVSSSERSQVIFRIPDVKKALPVIEDVPYTLLRTREHWAAYLFSKSSRSITDERPKWVEETLRQLEAARTLAHGVARMRAQRHHGYQCSTCVLRGGPGAACEYEEICRGLEGQAARIAQQRNTYENLTLSANAKDYVRVLAEVNEQHRHKGEDRIERCVSLLEAFIKNSELVDGALTRMKAIEELLEVQSTFGGVAANALSHRDVGGDVHRIHEHITIVMQYLPVRPKIVLQPYRGMLDLIIEYYTAPSTLRSGHENRAKLRRAYRQYFEAEQFAVAVSGEHELVRCYLYLAFDTQEGDEHALGRASDLIKDGSRYAELAPEFYCVACWAARRVRRYRAAEAYIVAALREYPTDPRFHHARALNILAWRMDDKTPELCKYTFNDATAACQTALQLYSQDRSTAEEVIATCYCDLALFLCIDPKDPAYDLARAREAVEEIRNYVPKSQWKPRFPEFHYVEALLEYREFQSLEMNGNSPDEVCFKLHRARIEVTHAVSLPKAAHLKLQKQIETKYQKLKCHAILKEE